MSRIIFEMTEDHLKLLQNLKWSTQNNIISAVGDEGDGVSPPFGTTDIYEAIDQILNGKPANVDPLNEQDFPEYTPEQKAAWDKLYSELPWCLSIILQKREFQTGLYKTKFHDINWVKIK